MSIPEFSIAELVLSLLKSLVPPAVSREKIRLTMFEQRSADVLFIGADAEIDSQGFWAGLPEQIDERVVSERDESRLTGNICDKLGIVERDSQGNQSSERCPDDKSRLCLRLGSILLVNECNQLRREESLVAFAHALFGHPISLFANRRNNKHADDWRDVVCGNEVVENGLCSAEISVFTPVLKIGSGIPFSS